MEPNKILYDDEILNLLEGPPRWQGAEAKIYTGNYKGKKAIFKRRFVKEYRHPQLDAKLNSRRIKQESRCLEKALKCHIPVPEIYFIHLNEYLLVMEFIEGTTVKDALTSTPSLWKKIAPALGMIVANLHANGIIHGDLTTSNFILQSIEPSKCTIIDFGLASISTSNEDRAVDLYVLERAIQSTHGEISKSLFQSVLETYSRTFPQSQATLNRLAEVQRRGRKREMIG